jgi:hypothetical protein
VLENHKKVVGEWKYETCTKTLASKANGKIHFTATSRNAIV